MNPLDTMMIVILGVVVIYSLIRGIIHVAVSFLSLIVGIWVALRFYTVIAQQVGKLLDSHMWSNIIGFLIIFFLVSISISLAGMLLRKLLKIGNMRWIDRVGGAIFGLVMGCVVIYAVIMILVAFAPPQAPFLKTSQLAPHVISISNHVLGYIPSNFKNQFEEKRNEMLEIWQIEGSVEEYFTKDEESHEPAGGNKELKDGAAP